MAKDEQYSKREMDSFFKTTTEQLDRIETQVRYTNGRVNRLERNMLIVSVAIGTMLIMSGSRFIDLLKTFI